MFSPLPCFQKKADLSDDDESEDDDMDNILTLAAKSGKTTKKKQPQPMSAFQMLDVEDPDLSDVWITFVSCIYVRTKKCDPAKTPAKISRCSLNVTELRVMFAF